MIEQPPAPPLPATVDLRSFRRMPLDVMRLRDSDIARNPNPEGFRCAVIAWCVAWHQKPAGSLPDDDHALADLVGIGRTPRAVKEWQSLKKVALRGFIKCSDGRLYHEVVVEMAIEAWGAQLTQKWKSECARIKKHGQRTKTKPDLPTFNLWITGACPEAKPYLSRWTKHHVSGDTTPDEQGHPPHVPGETPSNRREGIVPSTESSDCSSTVDSPRPTATPGPKGPKATHRSEPWRTDPQAADRKMRELGLTPGRGELLVECVRRIDQELSRRDRDQRAA